MKKERPPQTLTTRVGWMVIPLACGATLFATGWLGGYFFFFIAQWIAAAGFLIVAMIRAAKLIPFCYRDKELNRASRILGIGFAVGVLIVVTLMQLTIFLFLGAFGFVIGK